MRRAKFILFLALIMSTSACSSIDTFAILNNTQSPLRLEYTFKRRPTDDAGLRKRLSFIAEVTSDQAGDADCSWTLVSPTQYTYDQAAQRVILQIPPRTAVRIAELSNYVETDEWAGEQFPIGTITLDGAQGIIHCEGEQARKQFKNLKRSLHAVDYQ